MKFNLFRFLICFEFVILYFGFTSSIYASVGMSVSPPVTEILIAPNKSLRTTLQLTNTGVDTDIILSLHNLIPQGNQGHSTINPKPLDPTTIPLVINFVGLEPGIPIPLKSGQTQSITLEIEAANLDEPQDVYFAMLARPSSTQDNPTSPTTTPGITSLFFTTITPTSAIPTNIALVDPALPPVLDSITPLNFGVLAENKTSLMLQVQGKVKLLSPNKTVLTESSFDPKLVLGNTTRQLSTFNFQLSAQHVGPHTLTIELTTLGGRVLTEHSYTIWILPLRYALTLLVFLLLLTIPLLGKFRLTVSTNKV